MTPVTGAGKITDVFQSFPVYSKASSKLPGES